MNADYSKKRVQLLRVLDLVRTLQACQNAMTLGLDSLEVTTYHLNYYEHGLMSTCSIFAPGVTICTKAISPTSVHNVRSSGSRTIS